MMGDIQHVRKIGNWQETLAGKAKRRHHSGDIHVDERIILKLVQKQCFNGPRMTTGYIIC